MRSFVTVASKRLSRETLLSRHPDALVLDVTSRGPQPWVRLSPFYPHGDIPVPLTTGVTATSVEGIWQALKVFERSDVDPAKLTVASMRGIKRTTRRFGKILGHREGLYGERLLGYLEARRRIYLPAYRWLLEHCANDEIAEIAVLSRSRQIVLLDYETNDDVADLRRPLSHASLIVRFLDDAWPDKS